MERPGREMMRWEGMWPRWREDFWSWDPFRELSMIRDDMDELLKNIFKMPMMTQTPMMSGMTWQPAMDIYEENGNMIMETPLPGMKKEEIDISIQDNKLTISGEMKREKEIKEENFYSKERRMGNFSRTVTLPKEVKADKIKAEFKDGILKIKLPMAAPEKQKKVKVKVE